MVQSRSVKGSGSARTEGARTATGVGADPAAVWAEPWRPGNGGVRAAGTGGCRARSEGSRPGEPLAAELDAARRHIDELSMEKEPLRECARAAERRLPLATRSSRLRGSAMVLSRCVERENGRARRSTRGGFACSAQRGVLARSAAGRRTCCRMRSGWRPLAATWLAHRSWARAIARSTRGADPGRRPGLADASVARDAARRGYSRPTAAGRLTSKAHDGMIATSPSRTMSPVQA